MQLVLNELSVSTDEKDQYKVAQVMDTFLTVYSHLVKRHPGFNTVIAPIDINLLELTPGYLVSQWRNSPVDREIKRRFLGLCDRIQILSPSEDDLLCTTIDGSRGEGIQLAMEGDLPLISLPFSDVWQVGEILCSVYRIADDSISEESLKNFSTLDTFSENQTWLDECASQTSAQIKTPGQLLEKLPELFPSLCFGDTAIRQIKTELTVFTAPIVAEKLSKLEVYFSQWDGCTFDSSAFPPRSVSPQSKETLRRFKDEHTFSYGQQSFLVSYHVRYTGRIPGRIYFYPDCTSKKCIICSLTTKLPTVSEPKFKI